MSDNVRAVRNNNPGNVEKGAPWQGLMPEEEMTQEQRDEKRFCVFKSPKWGFRAMARTLITYQDKYKITTIAGAVARWAPSSENDTAAYVRHVAELSERDPIETLDFHAHADAAPIVKAMAIHECGGWFFDDADLDAGLTLAGIEPPAKSLAKSRTIRAATAASIATGASLISDTVSTLSPATSLVREVASYAPAAAGVLVIGLLFAIVYYRYEDWTRAKR